MSEEAPAIGGIAALAIDYTDPPGLARWWRRVLGGAVEVHPQGYATLHTPGGAGARFPASARAENGQEPSTSWRAQP